MGGNDLQIATKNDNYDNKHLEGLVVSRNLTGNELT